MKTMLRAAFVTLPIFAGAPEVALAQAAEPAPSKDATPASTDTAPVSADGAVQLGVVTVSASADASAAGLSPAYAGGQVAHGGRAGILGTRDNLETPFSITAYTNELIQDRQAKSVGDVLQADPTVRTARGFGNFQESYFIRGFILGSDDVAYNGLYSLLPRQYIATELFERVEVLRGATAFLGGANPGGGGIGGAINLLPKRAPNADLTRVTVGGGNGPQGNVAADVGRRFGADKAFGLRINAAYRDGSSVDDEKAKLGLISVGGDWRSDRARVSADLGYQNNHLDQTRTNVSLDLGVTKVPDEPSASNNFAQPWSFSNERDLFGTLRGEFDLTKDITAFAAYGLRRSKEANSLANITISDAETGDGSFYRFDNTRKDQVDTGDVGVRGKFATGPVAHEWVVDAAYFRLEKKNAYIFDFLNSFATNLYQPTEYAKPEFSSNAFGGNDLDKPAVTNRTILQSVALGDTLSAFDARLLLTLGARYQKFDISNFAYTSGAPDPGYNNGRVSPSIGVVYRLMPKLSLYSNYIEGLTQGETAPTTTPSGRPVANPGEQLAPYVSRQKEIGAKFDAGRIAGSLALFSTSRPRAYLNAQSEFSAGGDDRHQGVEASVYGIATRGLRVLGGFTYLDAEQKSTGDAATDGKRVIGVPRWQASFGAEYDLPFLPDLTTDVRVVHTGASKFNAKNTLEADGWTRLDLGARYQLTVAEHLLTLRARIDNVTNEKYWASTGGFPGAGYLVVGAPRTASLSASVDF